MNNETEQIFLVNSQNQLPSMSQKVGVSGTTPLNLENVEDFSTVCRTCATITELVVPIFEGEGLQNNLADKIHKHLPIQVSECDTLPRVVCYQCASTLLAWHELVQCCTQADSALRARLRQGVPAGHKESKSDIKKEQKNKLNTEQTFYKMVETVLVEYLKSTNMDSENLDLLYVCQKCTDNPSSTNITNLAEHLLMAHFMETEDCDALEKFIRNNLTFEETLISDDSDREVESDGRESTKGSPSDLFCPLCESVFTSSSRLVCHLNQHTEACLEKGAWCCETTYYNKKAFVTHLQEEHVTRATGEAGNNSCRSCGYLATDHEDLQLHVSEHHRDKETKKVKKSESAVNQKFIPAVCSECNKTFSNKYNMFVHMKSHFGEKSRFSCEQCGRHYSNKGNLSIHKKRAHEGLLKYVCSRCGEAFPTRIERDVHTRIHTGDKPFRCSHCPKAFRAKNTLDRHTEIHLGIRKYACDLCPKKFTRRTHLDYHISTHEKKTKWNACRTRDPRFSPFTAHTERAAHREDAAHDGLGPSDIFNEASHERIEDDDSVENARLSADEDDEPLSCIATKKSSDLYANFYSALVNFRNHFLAEHKSRKCNYPDFTDSSESETPAIEDNGQSGEVNVDSFDDLTHSNMRKDKMDEATRAELSAVRVKVDGKTLYGCGECGKRLSSVHTYVFHRRIHTGERPCVCHVCGRQFRAPQGLQRHVAETHERRRRRACRACARTFANAQNLKQHMRTHTGERPFACVHCGKRFTQSGSLHVHLKTHSDRFPFECGECGAKFRLRSGLARHRLKHTGERPHACAQCGAGFRQRHELAAHLAAHEGARPHACDTCGAAFRQRRALRHHCRRVHGAPAHALGYPAVPPPQY